MSWILTNPIRRLATNRRQIVVEAGISARTTVLEVGAGNGFFTEVLVPVAGKVYVVELQEQMVQKLYRRLRKVPSRSMIEIRVGDIARVELPPSSCDIAFIYYSFHELSSPDAAASAIGRALTPVSRIYLVEPRIEVSKRAFTESISLFEALGFRSLRRWTSLFSHGVILGRDLNVEHQARRPKA